MSTSVHSLPLELLVLIFTLATSDERYEGDRNRTAITLVCEGWKELVYGTPSIWTKIHYTGSLARTMLALAKSQPMLIDVRFSLSVRIDAPVNVAFLEACNHTHRWRSVWLSLRHWKGRLDDYLSGPAPS